MTASKTVQLPVGNLGLQLGNSSRYHQKPCVVHVAQSSQMKGLLEKGDIIVGFQEGKVEHRNPTLSILKRKLDETQHARNRTITVVETKSSYKHSRPVKSNQNQAQLKNLGDENTTRFLLGNISGPIKQFAKAVIKHNEKNWSLEAFNRAVKHKCLTGFDQLWKVKQDPSFDTKYAEEMALTGVVVVEEEKKDFGWPFIVQKPNVDFVFFQGFNILTNYKDSLEDILRQGDLMQVDAPSVAPEVQQITAVTDLARNQLAVLDKILANDELKRALLSDMANIYNRMNEELIFKRNDDSVDEIARHDYCNMMWVAQLLNHLGDKRSIPRGWTLRSRYETARIKHLEMFKTAGGASAFVPWNTYERRILDMSSRPQPQWGADYNFVGLLDEADYNMMMSYRMARQRPDYFPNPITGLAQTYSARSWERTCQLSENHYVMMQFRLPYKTGIESAYFKSIESQNDPVTAARKAEGFEGVRIPEGWEIQAYMTQLNDSGEIQNLADWKALLGLTGGNAVEGVIPALPFDQLFDKVRNREVQIDIYHFGYLNRKNAKGWVRSHYENVPMKKKGRIYEIDLPEKLKEVIESHKRDLLRL